MWEVEFYDLPSGSVPVAKYLDKVKKENKPLLAQILQDITLLGQQGNQLSMPLVKPMGDGLYELRSTGNKVNSRIFYFFFVHGKIILTNGFIKKTQETPSGELTKARRYKKDYERRHSDEV